MEKNNPTKYIYIIAMKTNTVYLLSKRYQSFTSNDIKYADISLFIMRGSRKDIF